MEGQQAPSQDGRAEKVTRVALWLSVLAFALHRALVPMGETDLFFHLKVGDVIRATGHIPFRNLFSFTYPDAPDPDLAWGFQVLVSWLYAHGGFAAIVWCKAVLFTAAALLCHRAARRAGAGPTASAAALALAICAADQRLVERPHLVTFVGLGALACVLVDVRRGRAQAAWWLVPLALVWANFHAGVFLCVVVTALWWAGAELGGRRVPRGTMATVLLLVGVATFCTPAGTRLPSYLLWHTGLGATRDIEEFRHANAWSDPWFFAMIALCLAGALRFRRERLDALLPILAVGLLAWRSVRFVAEWAFLAAPFVALTLDALRALEPSRRVRLSAAMAVLGTLVAVTAVERRGRTLHLGLADDVVPFAAIDFVTKRDLRAHLYEDLDVGCYLLWEGWPRWRVFQDARLPAYPDDFHRALDQTPDVEFDALLAKYGVDAALINYPDINMRAGAFDPEEWALVWRDDEALVFARRTPEHAALILEREIPLRIRFRYLGGSSVEPIRRPPARSPVPEPEWLRRLARELWAEARRG